MCQHSQARVSLFLIKTAAVASPAHVPVELSLKTELNHNNWLLLQCKEDRWYTYSHCPQAPFAHLSCLHLDGSGGTFLLLLSPGRWRRMDGLVLLTVQVGLSHPSQQRSRWKKEALSVCYLPHPSMGSYKDNVAVSWMRLHPIQAGIHLNPYSNGITDEQRCRHMQNVSPVIFPLEVRALQAFTITK